MIDPPENLHTFLLPMKFSLLLVAAMSFLPSTSIEARPFTNTEGKTLEAEIVRASATEVTLRMVNQRTATVKISSLSEIDQAYVRKWVISQIPSLRVTPNMVRKTTKESRKSFFSTSTKYYRQNYELEVDFQNNDNTKGLDTTSLKYMLIGQSVNDPEKHRILGVQTEDLEVAAGGKHTVVFEKEQNTYSEASSYGSYKCIGFVLYGVRKKDNREVYRYASTPQLEEALYSIIQLGEREMADQNFQPTGERGRSSRRENWKPEDLPEILDPRRRETPPKDNKRPSPPIIIK